MQSDFKLDQWLVQPQLNTVVDPDNKTIQLEPKVMELLVYLADHAGEVVSKDALLQALWPRNSSASHRPGRSSAAIVLFIQQNLAGIRILTACIPAALYC